MIDSYRFPNVVRVDGVDFQRVVDVEIDDEYLRFGMINAYAHRTSDDEYHMGVVWEDVSGIVRVMFDGHQYTADALLDSVLVVSSGHITHAAAVQELINKLTATGASGERLVRALLGKDS